MKISKKDALNWFRFFASLDYEQNLMVNQQEIVYATFTQIERAVQKRYGELKGQIKNLKSFKGRTLYVGNEVKFPNGCRSCLAGSGISAVRRTNKCNIECRFCYNYGELDSIEPIGEDMWEIGGAKYYEEDIDLLLSIQEKPTGIAYVYLEPFMEIEKYYSIVHKFHEHGVYQHLYTNGTLADEMSLIALADAGLDEIRFNLGASGCSDKVIDNIATAKKYIPHVGIETPMTPEFYEAFLLKKEQILSTGLDFMNCAELHLNENNIENYMGENLYVCRQGYVSPIWSRELTLKLMKTADDENWDIVVHDCSNLTKFARGMNLAQKEGKCFGANSYGFEFYKTPYEAFLPVLEDESFCFLEEEKLPYGYNPGDIMY